ncbi:hypothetical protein TSAR_015710 [Trichomalopsis sarcophagae]|uniref:Uncharacterized protein n=1 Tax=Trichomalopsis sarcophagae TaxID=543379 RepID=A0A232EPF1_9HYME|nr:hypothetical protein TSAR_015710 [Trichomalopsis sarcophagae]
MTMDGMEVIGSHAHPAATSPFLLSSPPLSHHHATFNVQTVQLSFDACLTYNTSTTCEQHQRITDNPELRQLNIEQPSQLLDKSVSIKKRRFQRTNCDGNNKECTVECQDVEPSSDEKDKPGDLNTPVTTSSDLPSFFGPAALVEPPPISGNYLHILEIGTACQDLPKLPVATRCFY